MRRYRFLFALSLLTALPLSPPATAAEPAPLPASAAEFTGTGWQMSLADGRTVELVFLRQGKVLVTYDKSTYVGTWAAIGADLTVTVPDRGRVTIRYGDGKLIGALALTGLTGPITKANHAGRVDMDQQIMAEQMHYAPCDWINEAVRITARKSALVGWMNNGRAFAMDGYDNAKRSELRNRLIVARAGKGKGFGGVKKEYLAFHRMLESCPIRHEGKLYPLEGLVRLSRDKESYAELVYSYFRLRGATGNLSEIEIVIYSDWTGGQPFAVLDIGTGESAFPNYSSYAVRSSFPKGWQPFGVQP